MMGQNRSARQEESQPLESVARREAADGRKLKGASASRDSLSVVPSLGLPPTLIKQIFLSPQWQLKDSYDQWHVHSLMVSLYLTCDEPQ